MFRSEPVFDFGPLRQLAAALTPADGDERRMLHTLLLASQCDLLITEMLRGFEGDVTRIRGLAALAHAGAQGPDRKVFGRTLAMLAGPGEQKGVSA